MANTGLVLVSWAVIGTMLGKHNRRTIGIILLLILFYLTHLPPGQDGRHFTDDIFSFIFVNEKSCILIKISLKSVPNGPVLVQMMAWRRIGNKPLSDSMITRFTDPHIRHGGGGELKVKWHGSTANNNCHHPSIGTYVNAKRNPVIGRSCTPHKLLL